MVDIWNICNGEKNIVHINETAWRMAELQEKTSTRKLVDSLEEQKVLDELIEESKSARLEAEGFHPLLFTPFRYPPLKFGSRFGKRNEPSLWYGSSNPETGMAEKAYQQLAFINASEENFGTIISPINIFSIKLKILKGVKLQEEPFIKYKNKISSPTNYEDSQFLGKQMRENSVDGFSFISARDPEEGINIGAFNMGVFTKKQPDEASFQTWQCNTTKINVEFIQLGSLQSETRTFSIENFIIDDNFPFPAL